MATTLPNLTELPVGDIGSTGNVRTGPVEEGEDFEALVASIRERGVLAPVLVSPHTGETAFVLVDGHRRLAAARVVGLERIPARVVEISDRADGEVLAMVANVRRLNLGPVEEADAYVRILEANGWTQKRLAASLGVTEAHVGGRLKLSRLPQEVRTQISAGAVPLGSVPIVEKVAAASPALAEALVSDRIMDRYGVPSSAATVSHALRDVSWGRVGGVYGREPDPSLPFVAELISGRGHETSLTSYGLVEADHPELAARWKAAQADQWDPIKLVGTFAAICDQARAYGCLLELDDRVFVTDEAWMVDRVSEAIAAHKPRKAPAAAAVTSQEDAKEAKAAEREKLRVEQLAAGARNRDLERVLRVALSRPERIETPIARLVATAALESVSDLRVALVFSDLHAVTESGSGEKRREKTRTKPVDEIQRWLREWVLEHETAVDVLGRAAAVMLAHHLADERAMPPSQRPYHHERSLPLTHVAAAAPDEVDDALLEHFKERNSYSLGLWSGDEGEADDPEGGEA